MTEKKIRIPPLSALRAFEASVRLGGLSRAAEELCITKSAVSHQLRSLEAELGVKLLNRGNASGPSTATASGATLLKGIGQAFDLLDRSCREVRANVRDPKTLLNISASSSLAFLWLAARVPAFTIANPEIDIQLHTHVNQRPKWKELDIDLAVLHVRFDGHRAPHKDDLLLFKEVIYPVCSPGLIPKAQRNDPQALLSYRWLQEEHVHSHETDWDTWRHRLGIAGRSEVTSFSGMGAVVAAAVAGAGIAIGRAPLIDDELSRGRLVPLFKEKAMAGAWSYVLRVKPERKSCPMLTLFVDYLLQQAAKSVNAG